MPPSTIPFALVVDDDPIIRLDVCQILDEAGYRCLEAETGDEAKTILDQRADAITLVFSDIDMPGETDGLALARHIFTCCPDTDVVLASARFQPKDGDLPGSATFIDKQFEASVVIQHLQRKLPDGRKPDPLKQAV